MNGSVGDHLDDTLHRLNDRLSLLEKSDNAELAFIHDQLKDIKKVVDTLLDIAKLSEDKNGNGHAR